MSIDSDFNRAWLLILPEMASVLHSLGQILCGEEGQPRPVRVFCWAVAALHGELGLDATRIGHNTVVRRLEAALRRTPRDRPDLPFENESGRLSPGLKEIGIEHQLQLARPCRWELATNQFETLGLLVLGIGNELEIVLRGCSSGRLWGRTRASAGSQRAFPPAAVAENLLDHVALAALDEADDLHLTPAARAFHRVDFIDTFDEHCPSGKCAARRRLLGEHELAMGDRGTNGPGDRLGSHQSPFLTVSVGAAGKSVLTWRRDRPQRRHLEKSKR